MRLLVAGSGSGGHLRPALALADALEGLSPDLDVLFCTPGDGQEWRFLGQSRWRHLVVKRIRAGGRDLPSLSRAARGMKEVRSFRPDLGLGVGGAAGILPLLAARLAGAPLVLLEANRVAGRANRLLARVARRVLTQFPDAGASLPARTPVTCCGLPVRKDLFASCSPRAARRALGLEPLRSTLLVVGGSQGAVGLNERFVRAAHRLGASRRRIQVLHVSGTRKGEDLARRYRSIGIAARVVPFLEAMPMAYRACDLVVCRSGGSTLAELAALGLPSILVPHPSSPDRHQHRNAAWFVSHGAARMHDEIEDSEEALGTTLGELFSGADADARRTAMGECAAGLGKPGAAFLAAGLVMEIASSRRRSRGKAAPRGEARSREVAGGGARAGRGLPRGIPPVIEMAEEGGAP